MARVTITNNQSSQYVVPAPIRKRLTAGETEIFDGVSLTEMERSVPFKDAMEAGTITVVVGSDPSVPDSIELSPVSVHLSGKGANLRTDEFTNPAAADVDAIKTSIATADAQQVYSGAALNGAVGSDEMIPPRNPTVTSSAHADVDAVAVVFSGFVRNEAGELVAQTCTVTVTDGGGVTDAGDRPMSIVSSITVPAMAGTGGSLQFGFGDMLGLAAKMKSRAGLLAPIRQVVAGAVVTTGTFATPSGSAVTGYTAASVPDGTRDYALTYEVDA